MFAPYPYKPLVGQPATFDSLPTRALYKSDLLSGGNAIVRASPFASVNAMASSADGAADLRMRGDRIVLQLLAAVALVAALVPEAGVGSVGWHDQGCGSKHHA